MCHLRRINAYFIDQNIMRGGDPIELNFDGLLNISMNRA